MAAHVRGGCEERLTDDTIVALSSGAPPAAIAIVRVSGPHCREVLRRSIGGVPAPRAATLRAVRDGSGALLDRALVLWFPGPATATGEDVAEFHLHGGRAVVSAVEAAIVEVAGVRRAQPGEFTRRALRNGRIDLAQAQGLADLLSAETRAAHRAALAGTEGLVGGAIRDWLDTLSAIRARLEAWIDHDEEGDVPAEAPAIAGSLAALRDEMAAVLARAPVERLRDGYRVVLAGPPNAGKSSLFNALLARDAAIVTPIAGTTRDRLEAGIVRDGHAYVLFDTAGLAVETDDPIEAIGIARSREAMAAADLLLWLADDPPPDGTADVLWVHARADAPGRGEKAAGQVLAISIADHASIDRLWAMIAERAATGTDAPFLLHRAEREAVAKVLRCCDAACAADDPLIVAEELRAAGAALGRMLGIDATEAMLDALFARFCLGK